jgi:transcriptional regulator GlxA family with amidase domain
MPAALYGLYEVFDAVGTAWTQLTGEEVPPVRIETKIVSTDGRPFLSPLGAPIAPHASLAEASRPDVVIVTDLSFPEDADLSGQWQEAADWVGRRYREGATVCSVCTGTVFLAESGLLDGEEATTHWAIAPLVKARYPHVRLRPERVLARAGIDGRIVTSGGSASWEDLALFLVARFCGEAEAVRIAKIFVFGDRSEGQLPYAAMRRADRHDDAVVAAAQRWIAENYAAANAPAQMVAQSRLNERTFTRRFKAATGYTPIEYVQTVRTEEAKQLLETCGEPVDMVALQVGYSDPAFFRRLFKRKTGVTPSRYRQRFSVATK